VRTRRNALTALLLGVAAMLGLGSLTLAPVTHAETPSTTQATGLTVQDGRLVESNGNDFVMRGVNMHHAWAPDETTQSLTDIKSLGANTVRVVLGSGQRWGPTTPDEVASIVEQCKANRMICVLEVHDTTGYGEEAAAATLDQAADYWISLMDVLTGQEDYVIINIGNEPWGNNNSTGWTDATTGAITKLRDAGFQHTLMVDAPNWGQDWENVMRTNAQAVYDADPTGNLMFSVHMYGVYNTPELITDYLNAFVNAGLPILVGEFGGPGDQFSDPDTILATAEQLGLGWLAWSWSGNSDPILDLVLNFDANQITEWGKRIFNGTDGIGETSQEATIYQ
jgi:mannan endo-1,4-beta-mannosidase